MILEIIKAVVLGVVEGVTEFLPVSSTGHLILVNEWVSFSQSFSATFTAMFDVVIQLGAILAVVFYYRKRFWQMDKATAAKVLLGVVPALLLGWLFADWIEVNLFDPRVVAAALIVGGAVLIFVEKKQLKPRYQTLEALPWSAVLGVGLVQCLAMIPGTSRSAATIIGGLLFGASRVAAVEFSFFLAVPTMVAASGYSLVKHGAGLSSAEGIVLAVGFVTAFAVALLVIKLFLDYVKKHDFKAFGYYRIVLGVLILAYFWLAQLN